MWLELENNAKPLINLTFRLIRAPQDPGTTPQSFESQSGIRGFKKYLEDEERGSGALLEHVPELRNDHLHPKEHY